MFTRALIFHVASGQAFFSGASCLVLAVGLSALRERRRFRITRNVLIYLGAALIFLSATPMPPWFSLVLVVASVLCLGFEAFGRRVPRRLVLGARAVVVALWIAAALAEIPYQLSPKIAPIGRPTLGIIGDSVTAGMGDPKIETWPGILAARHAVVVRDHSVWGANVASAMKQAGAVSPDERILLLEIGGNDILGHSTAEEFESGLAKLLSAVRRPGRTVVMLELPLPPTYNAFGLIQRRLARRFGTLLVPKRVLLGVLQQRGTTLDSIHLSQEGHRSMADAMWDVIRGAYEDEK